MILYDNDSPISKEEIYSKEIEYYNSRIIKEYKEIKCIDYNKVNSRYTEIFQDKDYNLPQNIFFIKVSEGFVLFGRKILSVLHRNKELTALNCSRIDANMIIGILKNYKYDTPNIIIEYLPLNDSERMFIYNRIKKDKMIDIQFPFTYHDFYTKEEKTSPKDGWKYYDNLDIYLARGEKHIRKETINFLSTEPLSPETVMYDPACSTGNFLSEIKDNFPFVFTIGADLSAEMMDVAQKKLDLALCENAYNSSICDNSVDYLFLRFLNYHVVTKKDALELYKTLLKKVKSNGKIICFGHTPVLLKKEELLSNECDLECCSAYDSEYDSKFQYYVLKRNG